MQGGTDGLFGQVIPLMTMFCECCHSCPNRQVLEIVRSATDQRLVTLDLLSFLVRRMFYPAILILTRSAAGPSQYRKCPSRWFTKRLENDEHAVLNCTHSYLVCCT
jgi:hypothetical protein